MKYFLGVMVYICSACTPLNATQFGQMAIADPLTGSRLITYEKVKGYGVVEGDILLGTLEQLNYQGAVIIPQLGGTRWPEGIVPYKISTNLPFKNKAAIYEAMNHWAQHSKIKFVELNPQNYSEYRDYIFFLPLEGKNCSSFVGRQGGRQIIGLSPSCTAMNTVHELGHSLGMWHEQSRADRNSYIRIRWENIEEKYKYNFNQHITDGLDYGEYDYQSIMHYSPFAFSKNGMETIIPLIEGVVIGQRNQLSPKDIEAINAMYP